jgi:formylglycine-generating enzyme required for sulfatase activity
MEGLMRRGLQGFFLIGASLGTLTLAVLAVTAGAAQAQTRSPGQVFRDCANVCPEMVVVPSGSFMMGSPAGVGAAVERPQRTVTFTRPFAVGRFEVTFAEWDACVAEGGCPRAYSPTEGPGHDEGWGRGRRPAINVSWPDANRYVLWLSSKTGQRYRLLSEAEWEYSARAGTRSAYGWGRDTITNDEALFESLIRRTIPVGAYSANGFGLEDMHGNVWEWVHDCWNETYSGAPIDGSAWTQGNCSLRVLRGGSWRNSSGLLRSALRLRVMPGLRDDGSGFRVARTL